MFWWLPSIVDAAKSLESSEHNLDGVKSITTLFIL